MTVADVLAVLRAITTDATAVGGLAHDAGVSAVTYDSRRAVAGSVFVALRGLKADGTEFAAQAAARGASLIVTESPRPDDCDTPWLIVSDARQGGAGGADGGAERWARALAGR